MLDIKDYLLEYKRKIPNIMLLWTIFLVFIIIVILIINNYFKIVDYYQIQGIVKDNKLNLVLPVEKINSIIEEKYIYINEEKYKYKVESINSDIIQDNNSFYQNVILDISLKDKELVENNIINSKFIISKKTILEYIYNLIKGEV